MVPNQPLYIPHDYRGIHQREVEALRKTCDMVLPECTREAIRQYRPLNEKLNANLKEWSESDPVDTLVVAEAAHRTFVLFQTAIYVVLTGAEPEECDIDYDCVERHLREIIESPVMSQKARDLRGRSAETFMNILQLFLNNRRACSWRADVIKLLTNVADDAEALPSIVKLENVTKKSMVVNRGGFGDVAQGEYKNKLVAIKTIRMVSETKLPNQRKQYRMEVLIALQVDHPNVHPLLGVAEGMDLTLVSEWQENGDLNAFLKQLKARGEEPDYTKLFLGIAAGIEHLHTQLPPIAHGDLRGDNVLIKADGTPCISDWGLSKFQHDKDRSRTLRFVGSAVRWMAPELLENDRPTALTDVYAFGMTLLEVLTGDRPFHSLPTDNHVIKAITNGERPAMPTPLPPRYIRLIKLCWREDQDARPNIKEVIAQLDWIAKNQPGAPRTRNSFSPPYESKLYIERELEVDLQKIKKRLEHKLDVKINLGTNLTQFIPLVLIGPEHDVRKGELEIKELIKKNARKVVKTLPLPPSFTFGDRSVDDDELAVLESKYWVDIDKAERSLTITGPKTFVFPAVEDFKDMIEKFHQHYGLGEFTISEAGAERILDAPQNQELSLSNLEIKTGMQIQITPQGMVSILGPKPLLRKAQQYIEDLASDVDDETTVRIEVREPDVFQPLREVMPMIITHCNGPTSAAAYDEMVQFIEDSDLHGPRLLVDVTGSPSLVQSVVNTCKSWSLARTPVTKQVEIPGYKSVALLNPEILGLESLATVGSRVGLGDVTVQLLPDIVVDSLFVRNSNQLKYFRILQLRGPAGALHAIEEEIERRLDALTGLQWDVSMPGWMRKPLRQLRTKETIEAFGVTVDDTMDMGPVCRWILSARDLRSLNQAKEHLTSVIKQYDEARNSQDNEEDGEDGEDDEEGEEGEEDEGGEVDWRYEEEWDGGEWSRGGKTRDGEKSESESEDYSPPPKRFKART